MASRSRRTILEKEPGIPHAHAIVRALRHARVSLLRTVLPGRYYLPISDRSHLRKDVSRISGCGRESRVARGLGVVRQLALTFVEPNPHRLPALPAAPDRARRQREAMATHLPRFLPDGGGSLWLRKSR